MAAASGRWRCTAATRRRTQPADRPRGVVGVSEPRRGRAARALRWPASSRDAATPSRCGPWRETACRAAASSMGSRCSDLPAPLPAMSRARSLALRRRVPRRRGGRGPTRYAPSARPAPCAVLRPERGVRARASAAGSASPLAVSSHGETFMDEDAVFDSRSLLRTGPPAVRSRRAAFVTGCSDLHARRPAGPVRAGRRRTSCSTASTSTAREARHPAAEGAPTISRWGGSSTSRAWTCCCRRSPRRRCRTARACHRRRRLRAARSWRRLAARARHRRPCRPRRPPRARRGGPRDGPASVLACRAASRRSASWCSRAGAPAPPVIATDRGGPPEFVTHLQDGYLVAADDVDELRAALEFVLGDPVAAAGMARAGRRRVHDFTWAGRRRRLRGALSRARRRSPPLPGRG